MREGEPGDQAFLVADGELEVLVGDKRIATLGRGDLVGEIALLRGGVRTATVVSKTDSLLFEIERETFMETLGGARAIQRLVEARLGEAAPTGRIRRDRSARALARARREARLRRPAHLRRASVHRGSGRARGRRRGDRRRADRRLVSDRPGTRFGPRGIRAASCPPGPSR